MRNPKNYLSIITVLFFATTFAFISCDNKTKTDDNKNLLPVSTINNPRSADGNKEDLEKLGKLVFTDTTHDFGKMKQGEIVECEFEYINSGKSNLLINQAKSSCGCTIPDIKREPILPNEKGVMKVKFNSTGKHGMIDKTVDVITNGNPGNVKVTITAEVID